MGVEKDIKCTKELIKNLIDKSTFYNLKGKYTFKGYKHFWPQTNENLVEALSLISYEDKHNALCVAGSGDQAFSLVTKGIYDIDLFDVNIITNYYALGLKRAMILKYSYEEFLKVQTTMASTFTSLNEYTALILELIPYMEESYQRFWYEIMHFNYKYQKQIKTNINIFKILSINPYHYNTKISYLQNKGEYNKLRNSIANVNFSFKPLNILDNKLPLKGKYDIIYLSNILDYAYKEWGKYWPISKLKNHVNYLEQFCSNEGVIFLHYVFQGTISKPFDYTDAYLRLSKSAEYHLFPSAYERRGNDGMILKRINRQS